MQISNPLISSLLFPLAITFASLLSAGLLGTLIAFVVLKDAVLKRLLVLRLISWTIISIISVLVVLSGTFVFASLCSLLSIACINEYCLITHRNRWERIVLLAAAAVMPLLACYSMPGFVGFAFICALILASITLIETSGFEGLCISVVALAYVPFLVCHAVLLYKTALIGPTLLITVVSSSALANIFAFVFGKIFGGPKLAPKISPNKTWSGVSGSICGAYTGFFLLSQTAHLRLSFLLTFAIPLVIAISGILGDLFESLLKRSFQVKDAGAWLPGFGGALDRVDGLLFVIPCVYYLFAAAL